VAGKNTSVGARPVLPCSEEALPHSLFLLPVTMRSLRFVFSVKTPSKPRIRLSDILGVTHYTSQCLFLFDYNGRLFLFMLSLSSLQGGDKAAAFSFSPYTVVPSNMRPYEMLACVLV